MKSKGGAAIAASVLGFGWMVANMGSPVPTPVSERVPGVQREIPFARSTSETAKEVSQPPQNRTSQAFTPPIKQWPERPFQYQTELDAFAKIRAKIFLSEQEKGERERLLHDSSLLRALGLRLTEASMAPSVTASQDAAVDLLIEALKSGDKALASEIARAVIEDPQVENVTTDRSVRENLAGIKAEVLYHWAAIMPNEAANIERALPGPVSQKIWANVNHRHASNQAESAEEIAARAR